MKNFATASIVAAAATALLACSAATSAAPLSYGAYDTRTQGSFAPVVSPSNDGDGSLELKTLDNTSQGKVSVFFHNGTPGTALGTLGSLSTLALDFFKSSIPASPATNQFAYRLHMSPSGTTALVWENNYNGSATVPTDAWQDNFSILNGNFWQRGNGQNFNGGAQAVPLSSWVAGQSFAADGNGTPGSTVGFDANSPVYALEIAYGSGVGAFTGYVDDIQVGFTGGEAFSGNVAVPEPTTLAVLGLGVLGLLRRRVNRA
ncbi:MAG TPA: PEP-CTERM sorting domain-containing protein [Tepidisphaeraceae bacterium]